MSWQYNSMMNEARNNRMCFSLKLSLLDMRSFSRRDCGWRDGGRTHCDITCSRSLASHLLAGPSSKLVCKPLHTTFQALACQCVARDNLPWTVFDFLQLERLMQAESRHAFEMRQSCLPHRPYSPVRSLPVTAQWAGPSCLQRREWAPCAAGGSGA